jgi:hypothetical protein
MMAVRTDDCKNCGRQSRVRRSSSSRQVVSLDSTAALYPGRIPWDSRIPSLGFYGFQLQQYFILLCCIYAYGDGTTTKILKVRQKILGFQILILAEAAIQKKSDKEKRTPMESTV